MAEDGFERPDLTARITRGTVRAAIAWGAAPITEMTFTDGRRADIVALTADGEIWIIEVKSGIADWRADDKWPDYRAWCDRLFFAVSEEFPADILPVDAGLIIADGFGAALIRPAPLHKLVAARRKAVTLRFARLAAVRATGVDPPA